MQNSAGSTIRTLRFITALLACINLNAWCQQGSEQPTSIYDRIWDVPVLYDNADNPTIQSFSLIGRYHGQYWSVNADQGNARDWENRRMIFGFNSRWSKNLTLQAQVHMKSGSGSIYDGLYVGFVEWSSSHADFSVSLGRLDYLFTGYERSESSKKINVIERGLLVNQIMPAEVVGAHMEGQKGKFSYQAGVFSRSIEQEFDDFNSGSAVVIGVGYETPLLYEAGFRATELVELRLADVQLSQARIRHPSHLTESISIPASIDVIRRYLQEGRPHLVRNPREDILFLNQRGTGLTRQGLWLVVKRWAAAAEIQGSLSPHTLRHTRARDLLSRGVNRREVQRFLGLSSPNAIRIHTRKVDRDE